MTVANVDHFHAWRKKTLPNNYQVGQKDKRKNRIFCSLASAKVVLFS